MTHVEIGRLSFRWVAETVDEVAALDPRATADRLVRGLESAAAQTWLGWVRPAELIAVKAVRVPDSLMAGAAECGALEPRWIRAVGSAVETAFAVGGSDVVRYPNRVAAVLDVVRRLCRGDTHRMWAWRLLGLCTELENRVGASTTAPPAFGPDQLGSALQHALLSVPEHIAPILADAQASGGLPALVGLLGPDRTAELAAAVSATFGTGTASVAPGGVWTDETAAPVEIRRAINAFLAAAAVPGWTPENRHALAVLALAGIWPAAVATGGGANLLGQVLAADEPPGVPPDAGGGQSERSEAGQLPMPDRTNDIGLVDPTGAVPETPSAAPQSHPPIDSDVDSRARNGSAVPPAHSHPSIRRINHDLDLEVEDRRQSAPDGPDRPTHATQAFRQEAMSDAQPPPESTPAVARARAAAVGATGSSADHQETGPDPENGVADSTARGEVSQLTGVTANAGLLFLLHLLDPDTGHPQSPTPDRGASAGAAPLTRRELYDLACELLSAAAPDSVAAERTDPAALAFCGLDPVAPPSFPDLEPEGTDSAVRTATTQLRARTVRRALLARLGPRLAATHLGESHPQALLAFVVRRRGEIHAEPGWLEAELSLANVSVDVRAVGLDTDPGWLPCIGSVVQFRYV